MFFHPDFAKDNIVLGFLFIQLRFVGNIVALRFVSNFVASHKDGSCVSLDIGIFAASDCLEIAFINFSDIRVGNLSAYVLRCFFSPTAIESCSFHVVAKGRFLSNHCLSVVNFIGDLFCVSASVGFRCVFGDLFVHRSIIHRLIFAVNARSSDI